MARHALVEHGSSVVHFETALSCLLWPGRPDRSPLQLRVFSVVQLLFLRVSVSLRLCVTLFAFIFSLSSVFSVFSVVNAFAEMLNGFLCVKSFALCFCQKLMANSQKPFFALFTDAILSIPVYN